MREALVYDSTAAAFPRIADRLGIVFTPVPVVDCILRSGDAALRLKFGKSLSDEGVSILEPFVGTGTFVTRLLH
jgi:predicted helicase